MLLQYVYAPPSRLKRLLQTKTVGDEFQHNRIPYRVTHCDKWAGEFEAFKLARKGGLIDNLDVIYSFTEHQFKANRPPTKYKARS